MMMNHRRLILGVSCAIALREQQRKSSRQLRQEVRGPRWDLQRHGEELQLPGDDRERRTILPG